MAFAFSGASALAEYPEKPLTMLVGFGAGGGTDAIGRKIAVEMEEVLGQPVVVVNKPGGGGLVSWQELVAAEPDGYTMAIFLPLNAAIQKYLKTSESWIDPLEDIRLLGMVNADAWGIAVRADQPYDDVEGFVEWARQNPGAKVSDGGPATAYHWAWEALNEKYGLGLKTVTYKGGTAGGLKAVAGGEVVAAGSGAPEASSMARAGLVKMVGIAAEDRNPKAPDVPTFREQGFDFIFGPSRGFAVPAGTPDDVVQVLADAVKAAYDSKGYQSHLEKSGQGGWYLTPEESEAYVESVDAEFKSLIDSAGMLR
ncbi:tripartite tricarboxylate transporter substrate binding protein [Martelella mediterranea]|uniref:Bug family tripartite tricarboxylate transporter substrate binding protein n=1 Tax=Martelella mediterranea TaxID=293089 RepID=UPI001E34A943|nr:tripartite tricarboxylate transporter substrate binding protein [Martelella mediterranea]MCD1636451.1 tripartite tricarboxylate transporter substrate binding protein [Martelella mediterranea]